MKQRETLPPSRRAMGLAAVTGAGGRTAAACLLRELLERAGRKKAGVVHVPPGDGDCRALLDRMEGEGYAWAVLELPPGAVDRTEGLIFQAGICTGWDAPDCALGREERQNIARAFLGRCRRAVLNLDDGENRRLWKEADCPVFTYSENRACAGLTARNPRLFPGYLEFEALMGERLSRVHLPIPGGFSLYSALAALAAGACLGLELEEMARAMPGVRGMRGRVEVVPVPRAFTVVIDCAHSPNALENILTTARSFTARRLTCLFGCPGGGDREVRAVMGAVAGELADQVVLTSDDPREEDPAAIIGDILAGAAGQGAPVHTEPDRRKAIAWALERGRTGDVILLAGRGSRTWQETGGLLRPLDERAVVADWFRQADRRQKMTGKIPASVI